MIRSKSWFSAIIYDLFHLKSSFYSYLYIMQSKDSKRWVPGVLNTRPSRLLFASPCTHTLPTPLIANSCTERSTQSLRPLNQRLIAPHPQLGVVGRCPASRHTTPDAVRVGDIVKGQDTVTGVIAVLIDFMDGHAATGAASMLKESVCQGANGAEVEGGSGGQVLGENANTAFACKRRSISISLNDPKVKKLHVVVCASVDDV